VLSGVNVGFAVVVVAAGGCWPTRRTLRRPMAFAFGLMGCAVLRTTEEYIFGTLIGGGEFDSSCGRLLTNKHLTPTQLTSFLPLSPSFAFQISIIEVEGVERVTHRVEVQVPHHRPVGDSALRSEWSLLKLGISTCQDLADLRLQDCRASYFSTVSLAPISSRNFIIIHEPTASSQSLLPPFSLDSAPLRSRTDDGRRSCARPPFLWSIQPHQDGRAQASHLL
jgi:hypothetical protein